MVIILLSSQREKTHQKGRFRSRRPRNFLYLSEEEEEESNQRKSEDELGFIAIKEDDLDKKIREESVRISQVEKKDWIIDSGCSHHMTGDMSKFVKSRKNDGGIVRVGNNVACHIIGIGSITLDGKTNTDDVYFVDGLKHNFLSVGQLVDKSYQL